MPQREKYRAVSRSIGSARQYVGAFIRQYLSEQAMNEFQKNWDEYTKEPPESQSEAEKYEFGYNNWITMAKSTYRYVRLIGNEGIPQFERAEIEMLKRKSNVFTLMVLSVLRKIAPGHAFRMVAKKLAYEMQWTTSLNVEQLDSDKMVVNVPQCKILGSAGTEDLCLIGCQNTYSAWFAEQFHLKLDTKRHGNGCTKILTPL